MELEELSVMVGLSRSRHFSVPWGVVEREMGSPLPDDYKALIGYFGPGEFSPFVTLLVPGVANPAIELRANLRSLREDVGLFSPEFSPIAPYRVFPDVDGLIPWGVSGTGETYYWRTGGSNSQGWSVVVRESRGPRSFEFAGGAMEFMGDLFRGRLKIPFIPNLNNSGYSGELLEFKPGDGSWNGPEEFGLEVLSFFSGA